MKLSSIHVKSLAINASNISTKTINGQEHYVIRGAVPIVDSIVMNGGLYPAEEINNSYQTMEGKLMPLPHPKVDGKYVSANDPRAINSFHVGAWAQNVSKSGDQVVMDVYINKAVAETKPDGKRLINRLDEMIAGTNTDPIHLSTGLLTNKEKKSGESKGKKYSWIARNMQFDHIAILLDEPGAGTPEEGVGMFVNADGQESDVETASLIDAANSMKDDLWSKVKFFLSNVSDMSFDDVYQALHMALRQGNNKFRYIVSVWPDHFVYEEDGENSKPRLLDQKYLITDGEASLVGEPIEVVRKPTEYEVKTNGEQNPMKEKMIAALNAAGVKTEGLTDDQVWDAYNEQMKKPADGTKEEDPEADKSKKKDPAANAEEIPAWAKALSEKVDALNTQISANADTERKEMREAVKAKFGLSDTAVNAMADEPLKEMFSQCQTSLGLNGAFRQTNSSQSVSEMPE
ncbi:DUF2213 domain-containing protein [Salmonella enterica subsp. enterica serovar Altona]|uniref:DUF2213 domain-containing protein n=1 Tax=Salmonella enterica TaxID=28901 RepID=UPI000FC189A4|nr:DUF2213 domain-containing protein [Salmonella enterica subsp. enterica serovar Emek]EAN0049950.1 DUF2213 domain-containing protein [Salmonella enterica]EBS4607675.1 DUF2213 domain-containing protein [Salmonella enterica subsp. enterica serovar Altona]MJA72399.1 DUF2213 domain-containing protein [Salmonella enterica subsp. enterica serovar Albany]ECA8324658.1 DUF2213 domain-containing protein [Salmonella enterica subsp. enterica serovar Emek]